jgi:archaemetzincin
MNKLLWLIFVCVLSCQSKPTRKETSSSKKIILRSIDFNKETIQFLQKEIRHFFNKDVVITNEPIPNPRFINREKGFRYSADSLIRYYSSLKNDTIITNVVLLHDDIFTTKRDAQGQVMEPAYKYKIWGLFGLGYLPGNACIISDYRLRTNDVKKYQHRIRTVVVHEIGHNYGLPHCANELCIMSDANEKISTVDNSNTTMCSQCLKVIQ